MRQGECPHGHPVERVTIEDINAHLARQGIHGSKLSPGPWVEERAPARCALCTPGAVLSRYQEHADA